MCVLADLGDDIDHHALDLVRLGVEEGEGHAGRGRTDFQDLLRGGRQTCGQRQRDEQLNVLPVRVQPLDVKRPMA
jgi:hypothetical protein